MKKIHENLLFFGIPVLVLLTVLGLFFFRSPKHVKDRKAMQHVYELVNAGKYKEAVPLAGKLARLNNCDAQFFMYQVYSEGKYVKKDMETAIRWLKEAAHYEHPAAQYYWGMYLLDKDPAKAEYYLKSARKSGFTFFPSERK